MSTPTPAPDPKTPPLLLEGRVAILTDTPLPALNTSGSEAFAAQLRGMGGGDLVAQVCTNSPLPRLDMISALRTVDTPCVPRLREAGIVQWPARGGSFFAAAYEPILAPRYWDDLKTPHPVMSEDTLNHYFITPLIRGLLDFQRTGVVHGSIRPTNIFWRHASTTPPQFGECLSLPCGFDQPALFETIERGQCTPAGRGMGLHTDDCYAFGVTLALIILGQNPLADLDDNSLISLKLEKGSFSSLIGMRRLASSHIELLRGLLADDPRQRWSATELEQWQSGRRMTPKSSDAGRRATRHFDIGGREYWQVRPLATALASNITDAVKLVEAGQLQKWLMRSFGDEEKAKLVGEVAEEILERGKSGHQQDQLISRICMALDPDGPIRYRGISVMPSGVAGYLAYVVLTNGNLQTISELISTGLVGAWASMQREMQPEMLPVIQQIDRVRAHIDRTSFGNGIERALYDLNPYLPCLSPMLKQFYVVSPRFILSALDTLAGQAGKPAEPMDRHLAAFLLIRDKRSEALFGAMSPGEPSLRRGLAMLSLFSELQYRYGPDKIANLAAWLLPLLEPNIRHFISKPLQEKIRREAKEATAQGNLGALLHAVDDPKRIAADETDFLRARLMYQDITREMTHIERLLKNKDNVNQSLGRPVAATFASFISIVLITLALLRALFENMNG